MKGVNFRIKRDGTEKHNEQGEIEKRDRNNDGLIFWVKCCTYKLFFLYQLNTFDSWESLFDNINSLLELLIWEINVCTTQV